MNKIIKDYIKEANYDEALDIMEAAHNRIINICATTENPWEFISLCIKAAADYKNRLHLILTSPEEQGCGYANCRRDYEN